MSDLIKIKAGNGDSVLEDKELAYKTNEKALYIGDNGKNKKLCDAGQYEREAAQDRKIKALEEKPEPQGVFYATYGVTTGEEINTAYQAGKQVVCKLDNGRLLLLVSDWLTGNGFTFSCFDYPVAVSTEIEGSNWSEIITHDLSIPEGSE